MQDVLKNTKKKYNSRKGIGNHFYIQDKSLWKVRLMKLEKSFKKEPLRLILIRSSLTLLIT